MKLRNQDLKFQSSKPSQGSFRGNFNQSSKDFNSRTPPNSNSATHNNPKQTSNFRPSGRGFAGFGSSQDKNQKITNLLHQMKAAQNLNRTSQNPNPTSNPNLAANSPQGFTNPSQVSANSKYNPKHEDPQAQTEFADPNKDFADPNDLNNDFYGDTLSDLDQDRDLAYTLWQNDLGDTPNPDSPASAFKTQSTKTQSTKAPSSSTPGSKSPENNSNSPSSQFNPENSSTTKTSNPSSYTPSSLNHNQSDKLTTSTRSANQGLHNPTSFKQDNATFAPNSPTSSSAPTNSESLNSPSKTANSKAKPEFESSTSSSYDAKTIVGSQVNSDTANQEKEKPSQASKANGTLEQDLISTTTTKQPNWRKNKSKYPGIDDDEFEKHLDPTDEYLTNRYNLKRKQWDGPTSLLKVLYKDFSSENFFTFILFFLIIVVALVKIYVTHNSVEKTITYSRLVAQDKKLTDTNQNLQLEFLALSSRPRLAEVALDNPNFLPENQNNEAIVVIPYTPQISFDLLHYNTTYSQNQPIVTRSSLLRYCNFKTSDNNYYISDNLLAGNPNRQNLLLKPTPQTQGQGSSKVINPQRFYSQLNNSSPSFDATQIIACSLQNYQLSHPKQRITKKSSLYKYSKPHALDSDNSNQ